MEDLMRMHRLLALAFSVLASSVSPAAAQSYTVPPPVVKTIDLSGPRFGVTFLSEGIVNELHDRYDLDLQPTITQFGWQFERQFLTRDNGVTAVSEYVVLLGGLDQGVAIPSLNWLVGMRTRAGAEFGVGPNITPAGVGLVIAVGVTYRVGAMNIPVNFAIVPSKYGQRVSVLTGFNMRRRR
jgi:hypothetical protein